MIAQRFRPLGWVAGVATAATGLYLVSLQVAAERGKLEAVERQIVRSQRDMRQLQTELGTRASLRQLEKWNGDVLALSAPKANQFLHNEAQLASLGAEALGDMPDAPPVVMQASAPVAPAVDQVEAPTVPMIQRATYVKPVQPSSPQRVAMLDAGALGDLGRTAAEERRTHP